MKRDHITSLKQELDQFVTQTQDRLEGLRKWLHELRQVDVDTDPASVMVDGGSRCMTSMGQVACQHDLGLPEGSTREEPTRGTEPRVPENAREEATEQEWTPRNASSEATDRLAAIKRRLAAQIENA